MQFGPYSVIKSLGKGGMGEVFLVHDPLCNRSVALKRIRPHLIGFKTMRERFLREAKAAAQLTHPSILPIYAIHQEEDLIYYTMPYVEGETLKQILRSTRFSEKKGAAQHPIGSSIPSLMRIFWHICQAMSYAHAQGYLHRDLKPENIIIGKYGETFILDWGLAKPMHAPEEDNLEDIPAGIPDLTRPGKIVGTLSYMAPERAQGEPSSVQTDIYSLGIILYQMLTLKLPFIRESIHTFRKTMHGERYEDPINAAPYRDIPRPLQDIVKRCLARDKKERYSSMQALIGDLEKYIEGVPEWIFASTLRIERKKDWEFHENIALAKYVAITRGAQMVEWVQMMVAKKGFSGNVRIEAQVHLGPPSKGLGFLLCLPSPKIHLGAEEGFCLWLGSPEHPALVLTKGDIELVRQENSPLRHGIWHTVQIERVDRYIRCYVDGVMVLHYLSHYPLYGNFMGILARDADFALREIQILISSHNVTVNCLAVPDALLAHKKYEEALSEYRRIGDSFPGRAESREALFRAGVTLLEQGIQKKKGKEQEQFFHQANEEFSKLRYTPGAPLEYLGKSLLYKATGEIEEEIKCLELGLRKYAQHPLLPQLTDHIVFRMHESAFKNRQAACHFTLLCLRFLPAIFETQENALLRSKLLESIEKFCFVPSIENKELSLRAALSFWVGKIEYLLELQEEPSLKEDLFYYLLELGDLQNASMVLEGLRESTDYLSLVAAIDAARLAASEWIETYEPSLPSLSQRSFSFICQYFMDHKLAERILPWILEREKKEKGSTAVNSAPILAIQALLITKKTENALHKLEKLPKEILSDENHPAFYLKGCALLALEGKQAAIEHFNTLAEGRYPPVFSLLGRYMQEGDSWKKRWSVSAFPYEKKILARQLNVYYHAIN